jgi:hypothetical protein
MAKELAVKVRLRVNEEMQGDSSNKMTHRMKRTLKRNPFQPHQQDNVQLLISHSRDQGPERSRSMLIDTNKKSEKDSWPSHRALT